MTVAQYCGSPGEPIDGRVSVPGPDSENVSKFYDARTVVKYSCNQGWGLFGPDTRECLGDGRWSGDIPTCSKLTIIYFTLIYHFNFFI